jgi:cytochrome c
MKSIAIAAVFGVCIAIAAAANAQDGAALVKSGGCVTCHALDTKKVGPPYKESAAKYKGKADAEATLYTKMSTANGHPEVKLKGDDLKAAIKWVLAQ